MSEIPVDERCQAIVKWVHLWRCKRRATNGVLCAQHIRFGARVPESWLHWRNKRGVLCCEPIPPIRREWPHDPA